MKAPSPGTEHITIAVSGAYGGHTMDFRRLAGLAGRTFWAVRESISEGILHFANDLRTNYSRRATGTISRCWTRPMPMHGRTA